MGRLEENLEICLAAVANAKQAAKRSANQTYYKPWSTFAERARNEFLLSCTRGSNYSVTSWHKDSHNNVIIDSVAKDPEVKARRKMVAAVMNDPRLTPRQKEAQIDEFRREWGQNYFWKYGVGYDTLSSGSLLPDDWLDRRVTKHTGVDSHTFRGMSQDEQDALKQELSMKQAAANAAKFGVGNCDEKGSLVARYLVDYTPGNRVLACCYVDPNHMGYTGWATGHGGDHVFCVYDMEKPGQSVSDWGENAIIADGWMNDAYPARHHLQWKYGWTYKRERINLKQFTIRNMICVSYRNHIMTRYRWDLKAGAHFVPKPAPPPPKTGSNPLYESPWQTNPLYES